MDDAQEANEEQNGFHHWWEAEYETCQQGKLYGFRRWWEAEYDTCPRDKLCTMLRDNEDVDELVWLVLQPQWIIKRLQNAGVYGVDHDIEVALSVLDAHDESPVAQCLAVIAKAARMSALAVAVNRSEASFQLYGRLLLYAQKCHMTQKFVYEIECIAERPWLKPGLGFLTPAGYEALETINVNAPVMCVNVTNECIQIFCDDEANCVQEYSFKYGTLSSTHLKQKSSLKLKRVLSAAISANGKCLVTGHEGGELCVWNCKSGVLMSSAIFHRDDIVSVAMNAIGNRMISASLDGTVRVWHTNQCNLESRLAPLGNSTTIPSLTAMSPDGRRMACARGCNIMLISDVDGKLMVLAVRPARKITVSCLAISRDGEWLAWFSTGRIMLWSMSTGVEVGTSFPSTTDIFVSLTFNADGTRLASGTSHGSVLLWDVQGRNEVTSSQRLVMSTFLGHTHSVRFVMLSADGQRLVSAANDGSVRVWDATCSTPESVGGLFVGMAVSADERLIALGMRDASVLVWRTSDVRETCKKLPEIRWGDIFLALHRKCPYGVELVGIHQHAQTAAFSADGKLLAIASYVYVSLWENTGSCWTMRANVDHSLLDELRAIWMSADGSRIAGLGGRGNVKVWDVLNKTQTLFQLKESEVRDDAERLAIQSVWPRPRVLKLGASEATGDDAVARLGSDNAFFTVRRNRFAFCDLVW